jgi:hypothetical protein
MRKSIAGVLAALLLTSVASAEDISREGTEALAWRTKMTCGTTEAGVTRYGFWEGRLWSRVPGEKDRHLFDVVGINVRQCSMVEDAKRGPGFRSVSREVMVYLDPATGEAIDSWKNPWTGETVAVMHVANDPVNMRAPAFAIAEDGKSVKLELRLYDDTLVSSSETPLFYTNPLAGEYQRYVGGQYHAMEIFNTFYRAADFLDPARTRIADSRLSWQRVSKFMPWMEMGDRQGVMIFNVTGFSTFDPGRIPAKLWALVDARFPLYRQPPPLDDPRPNETTWTVFKRQVDAAQAGEKR